MTSLTLPQMNGSSSKAADAWLQSSVQEFFSNLNWDDQPQRSVQSAPSVEDEPLGLETSVSRFFAAFNWDGNAIAAPPPTKQLPVKQSKDFTLDEFSDLF